MANSLTIPKGRIDLIDELYRQGKINLGMQRYLSKKIMQEDLILSNLILEPGETILYVPEECPPSQDSPVPDRSIG